MLKKSASGVLALLQGTVRRETVKRETSDSRRIAALRWTRCVSARQGWAGEKSGLFEHPAGVLLLSITCEGCKTLKSSGLAVVHRWVLA